MSHQKYTNFLRLGPLRDFCMNKKSSTLQYINLQPRLDQQQIELSPKHVSMSDMLWSMY